MRRVGAVAGASDVLAAASLTEADAALGLVIGLKKKRYITQQAVSHLDKVNECNVMQGKLGAFSDSTVFTN